MTRIALAPLALLTLANAAPQDDGGAFPPAVKTMLDAAIASGNEAEITTVAKYAALAAPDYADAIRLAATNFVNARKAQETRTIREATFVELIKGRAELGGYANTGNTDNLGVTASVDLTREGLEWRHKLKLLAEYQENQNITNREHYLAAYEPNYKITDRLYAYGALQFESDKFFGYTDRYSASAGAGYSAVRTPAITLDLELGPSLRYTNYTDATRESELGARGSVDFDWKLSPVVTLSQDASAYVQNVNSTVTARTAIAAKVFGPLAVQLSYQVNYESSPPEGRVNTDTLSRASLVYSF